MAEKSSAMTPRSESDMARRESQTESPFRMLQRFADEMDSVFDDFGLGRSWRSTVWTRTQLALESSASRGAGLGAGYRCVSAEQ